MQVQPSFIINNNIFELLKYVCTDSFPITYIAHLIMYHFISYFGSVSKLNEPQLLYQFV